MSEALVVGHIGLLVVGMVTVDTEDSTVVGEVTLCVKIISAESFTAVSVRSVALGSSHSYTGQHWSKPTALQLSDGGGLHSVVAQTISPSRH